MPDITEAEALAVVSLASMRTELRFPPINPLKPDEGTEHDVLITRQIHDAANFAARSTGVALADLHLLRPAIIAAVRQNYDGYREIRPTEAFYALLAPFRSYKKVG